jgi:protein tyrosine phosphatase (PTP) superfamily phosphohydrolase (DUF442 family)
MKYLVLLFVFLVSCAQFSSKEKKVIGENLEAHQFKSIFFSGQPSMEDLKKLKEQGFTHIINLRRETEYDERAERKTVNDLGMSYSHHPFPLDLKVDDKYIDKVTDSIIEQRQKGKTLVHCSSGNRVAIWLGGHFSRDHGDSKEEAYERAQEMGLSKDGAKKALKEYLGLP